MLKRNDLDAVIVNGDSNEIGYIRWVSNFAPLYGSSYIVIPADGETTLVSDSVLHGEPMHSLWWMTWLNDIRPTRHSIDGLMQVLGEVLNEKHLASKGSKLAWVGDYGFPEERVKSVANGASLTNINEKFLELKAIKSPREVQIMRKTMKITSDAMKAGCEAIEPGVTENFIASKINGTMMDEGAHDFAFFTMVVSGPKSGLKHAHPTDRKMKKGDMVYIDIGSSYFGYQGDMSRTLTVGKPNTKQKEILDLAYEIHKATVKMMKPGARAGDIAEAAYSMAKQANYEQDTYVGGHGLGTTLFDLPVLLPAVDTRLAPNMIFAYEPMIIPMEV
nr:aminopeptidase P family protein [Nitrososphaerota archaeon]